MSELDTSSQPLLAYARGVIERAVRGRQTADLQRPQGFDDRKHGGVFVTLYKSQKLRGCIGSLDVSLVLTEALRHAATDAALHDPRFGPVTSSELDEISIQISILSIAEIADDPLSLDLGRHGILIRRGAKCGLFLPQVAADHRLSREAFLSRCCTEKARLPADAWRDPATEVLLFTTEIIAEED